MLSWCLVVMVICRPSLWLVVVVVDLGGNDSRRHRRSRRRHRSRHRGSLRLGGGRRRRNRYRGSRLHHRSRHRDSRRRHRSRHRGSRSLLHGSGHHHRRDRGLQYLEEKST